MHARTYISVTSNSFAAAFTANALIPSYGFLFFLFLLIVFILSHIYSAILEDNYQLTKFFEENFHQYMETLLDRINKIAENEGVGLTAMESKIGASKGVLTRAFAKKTDIQSKWVSKIVEKYHQYNSDWLLTGNDPMLKDLPVKGIIKAPNGRFPKKRDASKLINFYDVDFAAGDIEFYDDSNTITPAYTMDIPEFNGCTAFRTYSNSMEKLIHSGDILFGTSIEDWKSHLEYGQIYGIVCRDKRKYLKYIRKDKTKSETHFLLKSENEEEYDEFLLPKDRIKTIWLIHGWINKRV